MTLTNSPESVAALVDRDSAWLSLDADDVIISSRVRLARNLSGEPFPGKAGEGESARLCDALLTIVSNAPSMMRPLSLHMGDVTCIDKLVLRERHLVSVEHSENGRGSGTVLRGDERVSVMINEEDHLRMQALAPGGDLARTWEEINKLDTELDTELDFAFSPRLGYLTACPSNLGTGMRASVMLHLPGLGLLDEVEPMMRGLSRIGIAVRGLLGEGTEASGNMFQVSNQMTLGESEPEILRSLAQIVDEIAGHERNARERLMEDREIHVKDYLGRSFGILLNARLISSRELLDMLSAMRLGLHLGMVRGLDFRIIHDLILLTQPGHMQRMMGCEIGPDERDRARAGIARDKLKAVSLEI